MIDGKDIKPGAVTNTNVNSSAGIELKKLEKGGSGQIVVTDTAGTQKYVNLSGDVTVDTDGVATVSATVSSGGTGTVGPQGPAGPQGAQGPEGDQGNPGAPGSDASVTKANIDDALFGADTTTLGFVKRTADDDYEIKNFGTGSGTVCQGNDSRLADARTPTTHASTHATGAADAIAPSDIGAEPSFSKNTAHNKNFGTATGTVCQGDDSRLSDARTPTSHNHSGTDITSGTIDTDRLDVGASSGKVAAGDHAHASYITGNQSITLGGDVSGSGTTSIDCSVDDNSHNHGVGTITGVINTSAGVSSAGKLIKLDAAGHVDATMINDADITVGTNQVTGLGGAAEKDVGTASDEVAQGNHTHAHSALTGVVANEHLDWTTDRGATNIHAGNLNLQGVAEEAIDSNIDYMVFLDGGATGAAKKESLADLVTEISGEGASTSDGEIRLTAANGILSLYASDLRSQSKIKYTKDITWETNSTGVSFSVTDTPTGDVSSAVCTITHNLNTKYIFVSVIEYSTTDTANVPPDNNFVQEQVDMNFHLTVKPTNDNNIELYTNSGGIYAGSVFKVAIMG